MPESQSGAIFTFGYGGSPLETLLRLVERYDITAVVDVRRSPRCRWCSDWDRETLQKRVPGYDHVACLGNLLSASCGEWVPIDSHDAGLAMSNLSDAVEFGMARILLLCAEADPARCHRSIIAQTLTNSTGIPHVHLTARDAEPDTQLTLTGE